MKMLNENDFLYAIDSDVIAHNYEGDWQWKNEDIYDLIFFERFWNGEVVAGGFGVKNNKKTRKFLKMWANLEIGHPQGFHSFDNGAIHLALMKWFIGVNDTQVKKCTNIYYALDGDNLNLTPYWKFINCARKTLGMGEWEI